MTTSEQKRFNEFKKVITVFMKRLDQDEKMDEKKRVLCEWKQSIFSVFFKFEQEGFDYSTIWKDPALNKAYSMRCQAILEELDISRFIEKYGMCVVDVYKQPYFYRYKWKADLWAIDTKYKRNKPPKPHPILDLIHYVPIQDDVSSKSEMERTLEMIEFFMEDMYSIQAQDYDKGRPCETFTTFRRKLEKKDKIDDIKNDFYTYFERRTRDYRKTDVRDDDGRCLFHRVLIFGTLHMVKYMIKIEKDIISKDLKEKDSLKWSKWVLQKRRYNWAFWEKILKLYDPECKDARNEYTFIDKNGCIIPRALLPTDEIPDFKAKSRSLYLHEATQYRDSDEDSDQDSDQDSDEDEEKKDGSQNRDKKDGSQDEEKKDGSQYRDKKDGSQDRDKNDGSQDRDKKDGSQDRDKKDGSQDRDKKDGNLFWNRLVRLSLSQPDSDAQIVEWVFAEWFIEHPSVLFRDRRSEIKYANHLKMNIKNVLKDLRDVPDNKHQYRVFKPIHDHGIDLIITNQNECILVQIKHGESKITTSTYKKDTKSNRSLSNISDKLSQEEMKIKEKYGINSIRKILIITNYFNIPEEIHTICEGKEKYANVRNEFKKYQKKKVQERKVQERKEQAELLDFFTNTYFDGIKIWDINELWTERKGQEEKSFRRFIISKYFNKKDNDEHPFDMKYFERFNYDFNYTNMYTKELSMLKKICKRKRISLNIATRGDPYSIHKIRSRIWNYLKTILDTKERKRPNGIDYSKMIQLEDIKIGMEHKECDVKGCNEICHKQVILKGTNEQSDVIYCLCKRHLQETLTIDAKQWRANSCIHHCVQCCRPKPERGNQGDNRRIHYTSKFLHGWICDYCYKSHRKSYFGIEEE